MTTRIKITTNDTANLVTRYRQDGQTWIVVGDSTTTWNQSLELARAQLQDGERLIDVGRDEECGGPVYRVEVAK